MITSPLQPWLLRTFLCAQRSPIGFAKAYLPIAYCLLLIVFALGQASPLGQPQLLGLGMALVVFFVGV